MLWKSFFYPAISAAVTYYPEKEVLQTILTCNAGKQFIICSHVDDQRKDVLIPEELLVRALEPGPSPMLGSAGFASL